MSLVRWSPIMGALNRWPSIWDDDDWSLGSASNNLDLYETQDEVVVRANVAGVPTDKVDITFEKGVLFIKAEASTETQDENTQHYSKANWSYSYRIGVPSVSMLDHTTEPKAVVENGVVTVRFRKAEASKPKKLTVTAK